MTSSQIPNQPAEHFSELIQAKLMEYQQCFETYRYIYTTLWQLGAIFGAITGVILGFGSADTQRTLYGVNIELGGWVPIIVWYFVFFRPMHRYALIRSNLLVKFEQELNEMLTSLKMRHMTVFSRSRDKHYMTRYLMSGQWWSRPSIGVSVGTLIYFLVWFLIAAMMLLPFGRSSEPMQWGIVLIGIPIALVISAWDQRLLIRSADRATNIMS